MAAAVLIGYVKTDICALLINASFIQLLLLSTQAPVRNVNPDSCKKKQQQQKKDFISAHVFTPSWPDTSWSDFFQNECVL